MNLSLKHMGLNYKGYRTFLTRDLRSRIWYGRVIGIQDVITYEGKTQAAAEKEFRKSIDAYVAFCRSIGREPNQPSRSTIS